MSGLSIRISLSGTGADVPKRVLNCLQPARLNPIVGRSATNTYRTHLFALDAARPNQLGGRRIHYFAGAARGTSFTLAEDGVIISIKQIGIRQRVFGGTIKPKTGKYLTIPVAPEAYGKRAREFGDLVVIFGPGGQPIALATKGDRRVQITQSAKGKPIKKLVGRRGVILFRLVRSVTQQPDASVLPAKDLVIGNVTRDVQQVVARAARGDQGGSTS